MNESLRGRGSNQYSDKKKELRPEDLIRRAEAGQRTRFNPNAHSSGLADSRLTELPDNVVLGQFSAALDDHVKRSVEMQERGGANPQDMERSVRPVARYEDAILTNHPNAYGRALIDSTYFSKQLQMMPEVRSQARIPGTDVQRRFTAYRSILANAGATSSDDRLTVDQLASNLDELYLTDEGTSAWGGGISESAKLQNRYAAASALAQGEKNPERKSELLDQSRQMQATLSERGIQRINL